MHHSMHAWGYRIEFTNRGESAVQLMTRHWVIVDANGKSEEVKGPGAKGAMPILQPGERWEYESGTRIATDRGSMHGWFTFEELGRHGGGGVLFPARVGRLALSPDGSTADVPCVPPTDVSTRLPVTSVHSTDRVIVGAMAELAHRDEDLRVFSFMVDLQVNNARRDAVTIFMVRWEIIDANGMRHLSEGTVGEQSGESRGFIRLAPGLALRLRTTLPKLHTPSAKISGVLLARFSGETTEGEHEFEGLEDLELSEIVIAPLGASTDGGAVPAYEPLGFLQG